jgi:hypothetical protein
MSYGTLTRSLLSECSDNRDYTRDQDLVASLVYDSFRTRIKKKKIKRRLIPAPYRTPEESPVRVLAATELLGQPPQKPPRKLSQEQPIEETLVVASTSQQQEEIPKPKIKRRRSNFIQRLTTLFGCASNKGN